MLMVLPWFPACGHQVCVKKTDETEGEDSKPTEEDIEELSQGLSTHLHSSTFHEVLCVILFLPCRDEFLLLVLVGGVYYTHHGMKI